MTDDVESELLDLSARVRTLEETSDPAAIASIHEKLDKLLDEQAARPRVFHWGDLDADEAQTLWTALLEWVQNVLVARYPEADAGLRDCWWQHTDVVDDVTALWMAWLYAYRSDAAKGYDPALWQTERFPALLGQMENRQASCTDGHHVTRPTNAAMRTVPTDYGQIGSGANPSDH